MALVTEMTLREQLDEASLATMTRYEVPANTVVTPAARAWLMDRRIDLVIGQKVIFAVPRGLRDDPGPTVPGSVTAASPAAEPVSALPAFTPPDHFDVIDGSQIAGKPEHLTALRGNLLVPKNHPEIKFRGQIDSLEADILLAQVQFVGLGLAAGVAELGEVLRYAKQILRCEVLEVPFDTVTLFGFNDAELRHRSHHPKDFYGIPHFAPSAEDGPAVVLLNSLRTKVREVELAAYDAFAVGGTQPPTRIDLIRALNRLSSAVYLMMLKAKTGGYAS
ncbi:MAG: hypothetical protein LBI33_13740 [Propionibacteriaceae bacterium]|nr:hypothetical protein [Propionibacteriaceae bacterium]